MDNKIVIAIDVSQALEDIKVVLAQCERIMASAPLKLEPEADTPQRILVQKQSTGEAVELFKFEDGVAQLSNATRTAMKSAERASLCQERIVRDPLACNGAGAYIVETIKVIDRRSATQAEIEAFEGSDNSKLARAAARAKLGSLSDYGI